MKSKVYVSLVLLLICFVSLSSILISCGDSGSTPITSTPAASAPVAKAKEAPIPKPKPEVKDVELTGMVEKMEMEKDKPIVYVVKSVESKLVVLFNKVDGKEVDLEQYVGKEVIVKGKASVTLKKAISGEEFKSVHLMQINSIEIKIGGAEKPDKPAVIKTDLPSEIKNDANTK